MESSLTRRCEACGYRYASSTETCPIDARPLPAPDPAVADLGNYRLLERLGEGGMGAVYRAVHRRLDRSVAIKLLQRELTSDRGIINRFFHEARAANTIRHEHVIEVYDFVESGQDIYFVMELLRGEDLHDAIHRRRPGSIDAEGLLAHKRPMDPVRASSIIEQIASALHATHARDIVHRDLKPENVFLAEKDGRRDFVKLFDFGVAKLERIDGRSTIEGAVLGTPEYMSPEQARGEPVDGRSDLYSLGCIAYEMLTRRQIFGGGTQSEVLVRQLAQEPPSLRSFVPEIPAALDAAVLRALAKEPAKRPQTALELAESVAHAIGRQLENGAAFRTISRPAAMRTPSPAQLVLRASQGPTWKPVAAGVVAAALLVTTVAIGVRQRRRAAPLPPVAAEVVPEAARPPAAPTDKAAVGPARPVNVLVRSTPAGASVLDERGRPLGVTPLHLAIEPGAERLIRIQKPGYRAIERRVSAPADGTISIRLDPERRGTPRGSRGVAAKGHGSGPLDSMAGTIDPFVR